MNDGGQLLALAARFVLAKLVTVKLDQPARHRADQQAARINQQH